jgi:murein DD-endopeptidase MepM/ murein hydrolase activator NlpD
VARGLGSSATLLAQIVDPQFGADDITAVLAVVQAGQADPATFDGIFALPIAGAPVVSHFGIRIDPIGGGIGFHAGLDFAADARTPIHAAAPGVVVIAGDCGGYGNCVVIDHGGSLATIYAHQSVVISRVGYVVTAGEPIGLVGSTGLDGSAPALRGSLPRRPRRSGADARRLTRSARRGESSIEPGTSRPAA